MPYIPGSQATLPVQRIGGCCKAPKFNFIGGLTMDGDAALYNPAKLKCYPTDFFNEWVTRYFARKDEDRWPTIDDALYYVIYLKGGARITSNKLIASIVPDGLNYRIHIPSHKFDFFAMDGVIQGLELTDGRRNILVRYEGLSMSVISSSITVEENDIIIILE